MIPSKRQRGRRGQRRRCHQQYPTSNAVGTRASIGLAKLRKAKHNTKTVWDDKFRGDEDRQNTGRHEKETGQKNKRKTKRQKQKKTSRGKFDKLDTVENDTKNQII